MTNKRKIVFYIIAFIVILIISLFFYHYRLKLGKIFAPFFLAVIIAYLLNPVVKRLERKKIRRSLAILIIYLLFSLTLITVIIFIVPEFINNTKELMTTLPEITARYQSMFNRFVLVIQSSDWPEDVKSAIFDQVRNSTAIAQNYIAVTLKQSLYSFIEALSFFLDLVLAMIIAYYFIKDAEFFRSSVLSLTPRRWRNGLTNAGRDINLILSNFIQGQLMTAVIIGTLEMIGLSIVRVKYPLVLGLIGGIANIIPYFGPVIGAIPAVAVALIDFPMKAVWTVIVFVIIQQVDNAFISPKIIEGRLGLHPVGTILAVLIGGEFFGILGMLVSVPVLAILRVILKRSVDAIV
ncbi:MAG: AI-2E family transporter [Clostridia bacterium]|nr:AI-2E family transporter [Clostridia bacterium]